MRFKSDITGESQLILERYTGVNYDGTLTYVLGVDGSGNVIKQDATDFLTDVPTLQEVTDAGNTTTNDIVLSNAKYFRSNTSTGGNVRMLGINAGNVAYVGAIDSGVTGTIFNASSTSNYAAFYQAGSEKMRIHTNGNIGIGTTSPSAKLEVIDGVVNVSDIAIFTGANTNRGLKIGTEIGLNNDDVVVYDAQHNLSGTIYGQHSFKTGGTERMRITSTGNVGIGTSSPAKKLDIVGNFILGGSELTDSVNKSFRFGVRHYDITQKPFIPVMGTVTGSSSIAYIGGGSSLGKAATLINFYTAANNTTDIGTARMTINNSGNVGINKTLPDAKLHIVGSGNTNATNSLLVESSDGVDLLKVNDGGDVYLKGKVGIGATATNEVFEVTGGASSRPTFKHQSGYGGIQISGAASGSSACLIFANDYQTTITPEYSLVMDGSNDSLVFVSGDPNDIATEERMRITSTGAVGIGTTSPSTKLHVDEGNISITSTGNAEVFVERAAGAELRLRSQSNLGFIGTHNNFPLHLGSNAGTRMAILTNGNVGIGTTSPSAKTHIVGSGNTSGTTALLVENSDGTDLVKVLDDGVIYASNLHGGRISIGLQGSTGDAHFGASGLPSPTVPTNEQDYGFYAAHNAYRDFDGDWHHSRTSTIPAVRLLGSAGVSGGNSGFSFDYSNNVGTAAISWTNLAKLETDGQLKLTTYTSNTHDGTPTSFLGVDASGNVIKTSSVLTSTPTLQEVTDAGNTTTNQITINETGVSRIKIAESTLGTSSTDGFDVQLDSGANAYLWNRENGTLIFGTNNTERGRFNASGNFGIGTSSPSYKLSVSGHIGTTNGASIYIGGAIGDSVIGKLGNTSGVLTLEGDGTRSIKLGSATNGEVVRIDNTNNRVGIGTTAPSAKLHVDGDIRLYDGTVYSSFNTSGDDTIIGNSSASGHIRIFNNASESVRITSVGNVGIGTDSPDSKLHVEQDPVDLTTTNLDNGTAVGLHLTYPAATTSGGIGIALAMGMNGRGRSYIANETTTSNLDASDMLFYTEGGGVINEVMRITNNKRLGIGTTSPSYKLHVQDDASTYIVAERTTTGSEGTMYLGAATTENQIISRDSGTGAKHFGLFVGQTRAMRIDTNANVGIGKDSSLAAKLHVVGSDNASGTNALLIESQDGTDRLKITNGDKAYINSQVVYYGADSDNTTSGYREQVANVTYPSTAGTYSIYTSESNKTVVTIDYVINDGTNYRTGTVTAISDGTTASITDITKAEIGDTSEAVFISDLISGNARIRIILDNSGWDAKYIVKNL